MHGILLGICLMILPLLASSLLPSFGPGSYAYEGDMPQTFSLPLSVRTKSAVLRVTVPVFLPATFRPQLFVIRPDDCIQEFSINGRTVDSSLTTYCTPGTGEGKRMDLSAYLVPGVNILTFQLLDRGVVGGVNVWVSRADLRWMTAWVFIILWGALCVIYGWMLLGQAHVPPRVRILGMICAFAFFIRLMGVLTIPDRGGDIGINRGWVHTATVMGVAASYRQQLDGVMLPNYPPLSLILYAAAGHVYRLFLSPSFDMTLPAYSVFVKLPAIIADVLMCIVLYALLRRARGATAANLGALIYAFHPAALYDSVVWGQTDSIYTFFTLAALLALTRRHVFVGGALVAAAVLTKMQAIFVLPMIGLLLVWQWKHILQFLLGAGLTTAAVLLPFYVAGTLWQVWNVYVSSIGYYKALSMNAYNLWWGLYGSSEGRIDTYAFIGPLTYRHVGLILFSLATAFILISVWPKIRSKPKQAQSSLFPFIAAALLSHAFFVFPTEMHERYLFPFVALGIPLVFTGVVGAILYVLTSLAYLLNLLGAMSYSAWDRWLFRTFPELDRYIGLAQVIFFVAMVFLLWSLPRKTACSRPLAAGLRKGARRFWQKNFLSKAS
ncbi:MAG: putative integral membrane protein [Candidatus Peregrinibacteria bacterium Greene0416_19]|nr:MAG: putative integral membrane protein [Candidatus Peregrinibacteria bacterium Greene0416_19]